MKRITSFYLLFLVLSWGCGGAGTSGGNLEVTRYEEEIVEFERENQNQGVQQGSILFLGGAPIRNWQTLSTDFRGMPVKNRGFGDATIQEINHYYSRLTDPFQAELMVMYAGENDILLGSSPEEVLENFKEFQKWIAVSHRTSRVIYISIMPSPAHWKYWPEFQKANALIQQLANDNPSLEFIDIGREMLGSDGKPISQLFEKDGLTLNQAGYARWVNALLPALEKMF